jgi:hypothetical protein
MDTDAPHDPTPPAEADRVEALMLMLISAKRAMAIDLATIEDLRADAAALRDKLAECRSTLEAQMGVARKLDAMIFDLGNKRAEEAAAHAQTAAALVAYGRAVEACDKHLADCEECDGVLIYCAASGPLRFDLEAAQEKLLDMARAAALALRPPGLVDSADPVTRDWHGEAEDQAWKDL